jgi:hypothetical protein
LFDCCLTRTHVRTTVMPIMQNIRSESSTALGIGARVAIAGGPVPAAPVRLRVRPGKVTLLLFVFCLVCSLSVPRLVAMVSMSQGRRTHVVEEGETLWGLARHYASSADPRDYVYQLQQINDLRSPQVFPGQELILPSR